MPLSNTANAVNVPLCIPIKVSFTYLGIHMHSTSAQIVKENFVKVLKDIQADIQRWNMLQVSQQGTVNIVEMNILPRV